VDELGGEKIDVVLWDPDMAVYIANALSPAQVLSVDLDDDAKTASVVVPEKMLSLAIGKEGQNARLAAKLTGWRIDIRSAYNPQAELPEDEIDDDELARRAAAMLRAEAAATGSPTNGVEHSNGLAEEGAKEERRKVRANNTVVYQSASYGPLPELMPGETVRVRVADDELEIRTDSGRVLAKYPVQEAVEAIEEEL